MKTSERPTRTWILVGVAAVVVAIVVASIVGVRLERVKQADDRARVLAAELGLKSVESALLLYRLDTGTFPSAEQGLQALLTPPKDVAASWAGPYLSSLLVDPWETPYQYEYPADASGGFAIYSLGADSAPGGDGANADIRILASERPERRESVTEAVVLDGQGHSEERAVVEEAAAPPKPAGAPFRIETVPEHARVRIMDILPAYEDGMVLAPREYRVEVSAAGFHTKEEVVWHGMSGTTYRIVLDRIEEEATLFVETVPSSALVRVVGDGGLTVWDSGAMRPPGVRLPSGTYRVEARAEGYEAWEGLVSHDRFPTTHRIVLDRTPPEEAPLFVEAVPADALVKVVGDDGSTVWDSRRMRRPGVQLPPGVYWVEARAEGYEAHEGLVSHGRSPTTHRIVLDRTPPEEAPLFVETVPANALVKVTRHDGAVVWNSRRMRRPGVQLPPGDYRVDVSAQGFRRKTRTVPHGASALAVRVALVATAPPPDQRTTPPATRTRPANIQEHRLIERVEPNFPLTAKRRDIEGHVVLRFTVAPTGRVQDVVIVEAEPPGIFDRAARAALNRWRYIPRTVDGVPVEARGAQARFDFQLED